MFCFSDKQELETDQGGRHENKNKLINRRCGLVNREHHLVSCPASLSHAEKESGETGSTKFTLFETVTSLVPPTSRGAAHRWPPLVLYLHSELYTHNTKINFAITKEVRARAREGCVCLFVPWPWPEEEVVVQQGCSRLEELGLFPCSRPQYCKGTCT